MYKSLFTIRKRKHTKHPQIVVKVSKTKFSSLGLTHSRGQHKHRNKKLRKTLIQKIQETLMYQDI